MTVLSKPNQFKRFKHMKHFCFSFLLFSSFRFLFDCRRRLCACVRVCVRVLQPIADAHHVSDSKCGYSDSDSGSSTGCISSTRACP